MHISYVKVWARGTSYTTSIIWQALSPKTPVARLSVTFRPDDDAQARPRPRPRPRYGLHDRRTRRRRGLLGRAGRRPSKTRGGGADKAARVGALRLSSVLREEQRRTGNTQVAPLFLGLRTGVLPTLRRRRGARQDDRDRHPAVWKSNLRRVRACSMVWRCSSPLDGASTAALSPRNDLVKNYRVHLTNWLISTQAFSRAGP